LTPKRAAIFRQDKPSERARLRLSCNSDIVIVFDIDNCPGLVIWHNRVNRGHVYYHIGNMQAAIQTPNTTARMKKMIALRRLLFIADLLFPLKYASINPSGRLK
jgi:hypothetical protein